MPPRDVQYRAAPAELRATKAGVIHGYAAVTNSDSVEIPGVGIERILPGAFKKALRNSDVRAVWNHNFDMILGREKAGTLKVQEDSKGLRVEIHPPDSPAGRDALESIRRGDVDQMSFGFLLAKSGYTLSERDDGMPLRLIHEIHTVLEVSPVLWPAYPETEVSAGARCYQIGGSCSSRRRGRGRTRDREMDELLARINEAEEELLLEQEACGDFDPLPRSEGLTERLEAMEAQAFRDLARHGELPRAPSTPSRVESRFDQMSSLELQQEMYMVERRNREEQEAHERKLERIRRGTYPRPNPRS